MKYYLGDALIKSDNFKSRQNIKPGIIIYIKKYPFKIIKIDKTNIYLEAIE